MGRRKVYLLVVALLEWFALVAQFVLSMQTLSPHASEALLRFFSYFTILTNLIVAIYVTVQLFGPDNRKTGLFFNPSVETAIALYIVVVGLIYNLLLRHLWNSTGLQAVLHDVLHTVVPILMLIYWAKWVNTRHLQFKHIPAWLIYPAVYAGIVVILGHFSGWYPYPFLDAVQFGYSRILINSALLLLMFLAFSCAFVFIGKRKT